MFPPFHSGIIFLLNGPWPLIIPKTAFRQSIPKYKETLQTMKTKSLWTLVAAGAAVALMAGLVTGCGKSDAANNSGAKERKVLYYQSAMHPWIKSEKPGRCTICGMELSPIYEGAKGFDSDSPLIILSKDLQ